MAQDSLQEASRKMAIISGWADGLMDFPHLFEQWVPRRLQEASQTPPKSPSEGSKTPQKRLPREPQEGSKRTPRGPKMAPKWHYESSKKPSPQHIPCQNGITSLRRSPHHNTPKPDFSSSLSSSVPSLLLSCRLPAPLHPPRAAFLLLLLLLPKRPTRHTRGVPRGGRRK